MDIKKIEELIEKSQLTDEAKDLIYTLLPDAEKPEVVEEILRTIQFEIDMNQNVADEAKEIMDKIEEGEKMIDAVEDVADDRMNELEEDVDDEIAEYKEEDDEDGKEVESTLASDEGPVDEKPAEPVLSNESVVEAPAVEAPVVPQWSQPVIQEPVVPVAPAAEPPAPTPQWNQSVSEQPAPAAPAPFPGAPVGQIQ